MNQQESPGTLAVRSSFGKAAKLVPSGVDPGRLTQSFLAHIYQSAALMECSPVSIVESYLDCARLGLWPGPRKHMAIVSYKRVAKAIPMYQGLIALAKRGGTIHKIESRIVRANDRFGLTLGLAPDLQHEPLLDGDRGNPIGAYAVAFFFRGAPQFVYMDRDEINAIRDGIKGGWQRGPWSTHPGEQWKKTTIRRLCKVIGTDETLAHAFSLEDTEFGPPPAQSAQTVVQAPSNLMDRAVRYGDPALVARPVTPEIVPEPERPAPAATYSEPPPMSDAEVERIAAEEAERWG